MITQYIKKFVRKVNRWLSTHKLLLCLSYCFLLFLLFVYNINSFDIISDEGHYALRSLFFKDIMYGAGQYTNYKIFNGNIPWWGYLSFHDHPIFSFLIRHLFYMFLPPKIWVSRLVSVIFMVLGAYYFIKIIDLTLHYHIIITLILSSGFFFSEIVFSLGRSGYLEPILVGLSFVMIYNSIKYFLYGSLKSYYLANIFFGLCILTKYSAFVFVPSWIFLQYDFLMRCKIRDMKSNDKFKNFFISTFLLLLIISPILIYNLLLFINKGYFDLQFSRFLHIQNRRPDNIFFHNIPFTVDTFLTNFKGLLILFSKDVGFGMLVCVNFLLSIVLFIHFLYRKGRRILDIVSYEDKEKIFLFLFLSFIVTLFFIVFVSGPAARYMVFSYVPLYLMMIGILGYMKE